MRRAVGTKRNSKCVNNLLNCKSTRIIGRSYVTKRQEPVRIGKKGTRSFGKAKYRNGGIALKSGGELVLTHVELSDEAGHIVVLVINRQQLHGEYRLIANVE